MNPRTNHRDAARLALLPLDCARTTLTQLFDAEPDAVLTHESAFEQYAQAAHREHNIEPTAPSGAEHPWELATFAALTALRTHSADPFAGTEYEAREPDGSAEARMLRHPLKKHPGLSIFTRSARQYYVATITRLFDDFPPALQAELAAVLLTRDPADATPDAPHRPYADTDPEAIHQQYHDRVDVTDDTVWIHSDHVSQCCQLLPFRNTYVPDASDSLPHPRIENGGLTLPRELFRLKLAEYAWHGWARVVHVAYNTLTRRDHTHLVDKTPNAENQIYNRFRLNNSVYNTLYATDSDNPQREWQSTSYTEKPLQIEDKRLITIVDCIRATPELAFNTPLPLDTLYDHVRTYFPPPRRPGNDITSKQTLIDALANATSKQITLTKDSHTGQLHCTLPAPRPTPLHPRTNQSPTYWDSYLHLQTTLRRTTPHKKRIQYSNPPQYYITPVLPQEALRQTQTNYKASFNTAQRTAAQTQATIPSIHDVTPLTNTPPDQELKRDELVFLTRIGLAMERQLDDYSFTDSMRVLRQNRDGTPLTINEDKLRTRGWLERHDEGRSVLYTVPADKRTQLGIPNLSHDGYGEKTTSEKSLHRKGIDQTAAWLAAKPDVTRVVRYHDLWRLRTTPLEPHLEDNNLLATRIDVIAYNDTTPTHIAEVETASHAPERTRRCIDKLTALTNRNGIETTLVTPNPDHLWQLMRHLDHPDYLNFTTFPNSTPQNYGRNEWETKLQNEGFLDHFFNHLNTYRSLTRTTTDPTQHHDKIVGNC